MVSRLDPEKFTAGPVTLNRSVSRDPKQIHTHRTHVILADYSCHLPDNEMLFGTVTRVKYLIRSLGGARSGGAGTDER